MVIDKQILYFCSFCVGYALIILFCELLHKKMKLKSEYTRKLAHVISTLSCLLFPVLFSTHWYVAALGIGCFFILYYSKQNVFFHSIDSVGRKTFGSFLLPLSICMSYYIALYYTNFTLFTLPIVVLAISDSLACVIGKKWKSRHLVLGKTAMGTFAFFVSTFIICFFILYPHNRPEKIILLSFCISISATIAELLTPNGMDNITIPVSIIGTLLILG